LLLVFFLTDEIYRPFISSADFYKDRLTDAELEELENPKTTPKPKKTGAPVPQRRRPSRPPPKKVASEEEDE